MPKRGPGKFSTDLHQALYDETLHGGADEEASYHDGGGWFGLLRGPLKGPEFRALRDALDDDELHEARTAAGWIIFERSDGIVEVDAYETKRQLEKAWEEILATVEEYEEEADRDY